MINQKVTHAILFQCHGERLKYTLTIYKCKNIISLTKIEYP